MFGGFSAGRHSHSRMLDWSRDSHNFGEPPDVTGTHFKIQHLINYGMGSAEGIVLMFGGYSGHRQHVAFCFVALVRPSDTKTALALHAIKPPPPLPESSFPPRQKLALVPSFSFPRNLPKWTCQLSLSVNFPRPSNLSAKRGVGAAAAGATWLFDPPIESHLPRISGGHVSNLADLWHVS